MIFMKKYLGGYEMMSYFKAQKITGDVLRINTSQIASHFYITLYENYVSAFGYTRSRVLIHMELRFVLMDPRLNMPISLALIRDAYVLSIFELF